MHAELLEEIINDHGDQRSDLITVLHEVQSNYNYLPEDALRYLSERMSIPMIDIYSIASFYKSFSLTPRGKHLCSVCMGTACHVRGAVRVLGEVERKLGIQPDETSGDKQFSLQTVNCLGACALGPIVVIDNDYHRNTTPQKINTIIESYKTVLDAD
jgi:NADH-quinone oxidoreductase subunit E